MAQVEEVLAQMRRNPKGVRFHDLCQVCDVFFGKARQRGSSHRIYRTPWQGDPRAKAYQVKQVLKAIERLEAQRGTQE